MSIKTGAVIRVKFEQLVWQDPIFTCQYVFVSKQVGHRNPERSLSFRAFRRLAFTDLETFTIVLVKWGRSRKISSKCPFLINQLRNHLNRLFKFAIPPNPRQQEITCVNLQISSHTVVCINLRIRHWHILRFFFLIINHTSYGFESFPMGGG